MSEPDYQQLYQSEKAKREQAETLVQIAAQLNAQIDLEASLAVVCQAVSRMFAKAIVTISLYNEDRQELYLAHEIGLPQPLHQMLEPLPAQIYEHYTHESGRIVIVPNIQALDSIPYHNIYRQIDLQTTLGISILLNGQLIGRMYVGIMGQMYQFAEQEIALLKGIADQAAVAIHRAQLQRQIQTHLQQLEQRVAERTAALEANNREKENALQLLREYTQELQAHNAELDAFAHTVAHDLHSPLSILIGYSDLLLPNDSPLEPELQEAYLRKIMDQGYKLHNIVEEILVLASVRKVEVSLLPITNMGELVSNALQRIHGLANEYEAEIVLPSDWPVVLGHGPWLEEVWANYLSNAIKYGGRPPCLSLQALVDGEHARLGVRDNGAGLALAEQERLFAPFTQLHQVRIGGHGLGLSIVQRIMNKLNGRAGVQSDLGQGSFFYFELPLAP